tara:strand:+ start:85449 stop:86096 length:648 start_codon:yes stop_codon:yes gene_type:complete
MKKLLLSTTIIISTLFTTSVNALESSNPPVYECSPEELHSFVLKNTVAERQPSPVPSADEVKEAILSVKAEEGSESCLALWGEINLQEKFQEAIQSIKDIDLTMSGDMIASIMEGIKSTIENIWDETMAELTEQICNLIDPENISEVINDKVDDRYGFELDDIDGSVNDLVEDELEGQFGNKADYLYDPNEIGEDSRREAKKEVRDYSEDFWEGI